MAQIAPTSQLSMPTFGPLPVDDKARRRRLARERAQEVLADYDYESIEFWEPEDLPYKRLLAAGGLKYLYKHVVGETAKDKTFMHMVEAICVDHWDAVEAREQRERKRKRA